MNQRNTAVKRIHADVKELKEHQSSRYSAIPLEDNIFEWHFTIRGPKGSDFEGGIYHGRILLSPEYPFKPPHIIFLTKNGRFEVGTRICLSISAYHPEHWQPAWGVRTMLEAIISFLPTPGNGAIGALDWSAKERKKLAVESHNYVCPICGAIDDLIEFPENNDELREESMQQQVAQLHLHGIGNNPTNPLEQQNLGKEQSEDSLKPSSISNNISTVEQDTSSTQTSTTTNTTPIEEKTVDSKKELESTNTSTSTISSSPSLPVENVSQNQPSTNQQSTSQQQQNPQNPQQTQRRTQSQTTQQQQRNNNQNRDTFDEILFYSMVVIGLSIIYLLIKKYNRSNSSDQDL